MLTFTGSGKRETPGFNNTFCLEHTLKDLVIKDVRTKFNAIEAKMKIGPDGDNFIHKWDVMVGSINMRHKYTSWVKPEEGEVAINSDGTIQNNGAGWGAVVRGTQCEIIAAAKGKSTFDTIGLVELQEVAQGLQLAVRRDLKRVTMQTDSENVVAMLREGTKITWAARHTVKRIKNLRQKVDTFNIKHIY